MAEKNKKKAKAQQTSAKDRLPMDFERISGLPVPAKKDEKPQNGSESKGKNLPVPAEGGQQLQPSTVPVDFPDIERRSFWSRAVTLILVLVVLAASVLIFLFRPSEYDERTNTVNFFYRAEGNVTTVAVNGKVRGEIVGAVRHRTYDTTGRVCAALFEDRLYLIKGKNITETATGVVDCVLSANGKVLAWRNSGNELYYSIIGDKNGPSRISGSATDPHYCLSPDGKELFYTSERDGSLQADVYSRTGTNPYNLENKGLYPIAVADDCRYLYYINESGALYVLPSKSGVPVLCGTEPDLSTVSFNRSCSELMFRNGTETRFFIKGKQMLVPAVGAADTLLLKQNQRVAVRGLFVGCQYLMDSFCDNYYLLYTGTSVKLIYMKKSRGQGAITEVSFVDGADTVMVTDKYVFFLLTDKGESTSHTNLWRCTTGKTEEERMEWDVATFCPNVDGSRILFTNIEGALYSCTVGSAPVRLCDSIVTDSIVVSADDAFYFFREPGKLWVSDNGDAPRLVREDVAALTVDCHAAYYLCGIHEAGAGTVYGNYRNRRADEQLATGVVDMK